MSIGIIGSKYGIEIDIDKPQVIRVSNNNESLRSKEGNRKLRELIISNTLETKFIKKLIRLFILLYY